MAEDNKNQKQCLIVDVSCDPGGEFNTLPIYQTATKVDSPIVKNENVSIVAIDNLPSLLPRESSQVFADQLMPFLLEMQDDLGVWKRSLDVFEQHIRSL